MSSPEVESIISNAISKHNWRVRGSLLIGVTIIASVTILCWLAITQSVDSKRAASLTSLESIVTTTDATNRRLIELLIQNQIGSAPKSQTQIIETNTTLAQYIKSADAQAAQARLLLEDLKKSTKDPESLVPYANLITGGLVLGLLAFLGLTRLGQIDAELKSLRDTLMKEVTDRSSLAEGALIAKMTTAISEKVTLAETTFTKSLEATQASVAVLQQSATAKLLEAQENQTGILQKYDALRLELEQLPSRYPFLASAERRDLVARIEEVRSVDQAEELASELNRADEKSSAIQALRQVVVRGLPGDADDFHNAHSEAMRLKDVQLGLEIAEVGLKAFPRNADLAADIIIAMSSSSRAGEAIEFGNLWLSKNHEVERTWRFGVFMSQAYRANGLDSAARAEAIELLNSEIKAYPRQEKLWSALARLRREVEPQDAYVALEAGLQHNPTSQELKFVMAEYLIQDNRAKEAREVLESAIATDFQEQFQPNVNQAAVLNYYAQCLEALGERDMARQVYKVNLAMRGCHPAMIAFTQGRLRMLDVADRNFDSEDESDSSGVPEELLQFLRMAKTQETDE